MLALFGGDIDENIRKAETLLFQLLVSAMPLVYVIKRGQGLLVVFFSSEYLLKSQVVRAGKEELSAHQISRRSLGCHSIWKLRKVHKHIT